MSGLLNHRFWLQLDPDYNRDRRTTIVSSYRSQTNSGANGRERTSSRLAFMGEFMNNVGRNGSAFAPTPLLEEPDAHGQAALLLAESTLHTLIEAGVLTNRDAIMTVQSAAEVKVDVAAVTGESRGRMQQSLDLLSRIQASLETDSEIPRI